MEFLNQCMHTMYENIHNTHFLQWIYISPQIYVVVVCRETKQCTSKMQRRRLLACEHNTVFKMLKIFMNILWVRKALSMFVFDLMKTLCFSEKKKKKTECKQKLLLKKLHRTSSSTILYAGPSFINVKWVFSWCIITA